MKLSTSYLLSCLMIAAAPTALADDHAALNAIYRVFFDPPVTSAGVAAHYADNVIHVGRHETPLVTGKEAFMAINIDPFVAMLDSRELEWTGRTHIVRRVISGNMANDVGYLYSRLTMADGEVIELVQKFSWVFLKVDGAWQVLTDFDATMAPPSVLDGLEADIVIDGTTGLGEPAE